jgi:hypothetical protein
MVVWSDFLAWQQSNPRKSSQFGWKVDPDSVCRIFDDDYMHFGYESSSERLAMVDI